MAKYLNINMGKDNDRFINVADTTAVLQSDMATYLYNADGMFFGVDGKGVQLDGARISADIQSIVPGKNFVAVELFYDDKSRGHYFIDPAAVTFITVSEAGKDNFHGIIIGVEGVGSITTRIEPAALTTLLDTVRDAGKNLLALDASEAYARWSQPQTLYVDTSSITRIRQDGGGQLWTAFKNSGELDIQIAKIDEQKIYQDLIAQSPALRDDFNQAARLVRTEERKQENAALARLAEKMSFGNQALVHIPSIEHAVYVQLDDIRSVHAAQRDGGKHQLYLEFKKTAGEQYGQRASLIFATAPECEAALLVATSDKTVAKKPKATLKNKK